MSATKPCRHTFRAIDVIRKKRDGDRTVRRRNRKPGQRLHCGEIPDYQVSAWLMAVVLKGMTRPETAALTDAMLHSGEVLDLSSLPAKKVDKHSTGGVGDKTSLVLAPLAAAAGVAVPMISGRGLGHTGGTLDKLEAIPGFNVNLPVAEFRRVLATLRLLHDRPDRRNRSRRPQTLRPARRHRHGRESISDLRFDHEQEARRRNRRARARRKDRLRRVHEEREGRRISRRTHGRDRRAYGQAGRRAHHRHGSAARAT